MAEILTRETELRKLIERGRALGHESSHLTSGMSIGGCPSGLSCVRALQLCCEELFELNASISMLYDSELNATLRAVEIIESADQSAARNIKQV